MMNKRKKQKQIQVVKKEKMIKIKKKLLNKEQNKTVTL